MKMFSSHKDLEIKVSRRFKYSLGILGFATIAVFTHNYLVKNNSKLARKVYIDKLLNDNNNEDNPGILKRIVRIFFNYRESQILLEYYEISFKKQYDTGCIIDSR